MTDREQDLLIHELYHVVSVRTRWSTGQQSVPSWAVSLSENETGIAD
jgi:hypothetical protein